jgi:hypothetical protein
MNLSGGRFGVEGIVRFWRALDAGAENSELFLISCRSEMLAQAPWRECFVLFGASAFGFLEGEIHALAVVVTKFCFFHVVDRLRV